MNTEIQAMQDAVNSATPDQVLEKVKAVIRIISALLESLGGKLTLWGIIFNAGKIIEAIKAIIEVIKAKPA